MELKVDAVYPDMSEITNDAQTLRAIAPAYAGKHGELTAVLQYVYQSIYLDANGMDKEARLLLSIAVNEMHHLEILGTLITKLGAPPVYTACPPYPVGFYCASNVNYVKPLRAMICADIAGEETAIEEYTRILAVVKGPVFEVIARIVEDEKLHLKTLGELLASL